MLLGDRGEQRPAQQELLGEDLALLLVHRLRRVLGQSDVEELLLVVPLVQRRRGVEALVALQADQVRPEHPRHDFRDLGLPDARVAFDEQRFP
jgi:hypothetical protein